jgi:hypothetical protein
LKWCVDRRVGVHEYPDAVVLIAYENRAGDSLPTLESLSAALQSQQIDIHDRRSTRADQPPRGGDF